MVYFYLNGVKLQQRRLKEIYCIRLSGKFVQLYQNCARETFSLYHRVERTFVIWFTSFGLIASFPLLWKNYFSQLCLPMIQKMSNIEHRAVIKFFTRKRLNAIEISNELKTGSLLISVAFSSLLISVAFNRFQVKNLMTDWSLFHIWQFLNHGQT